jgi:hypothetical protein
MMDCGRARDGIMLLLDGEIAAEERARLEAHLAGCAACRADLAGERRLRDRLAADPPPQPSEDLLARCRTDLAAALPRRVQPGAWVRGALRLRSSPAIAAALVAGAFFAGYVAGRPGTAGPGGARGGVGDPVAIAAALDSLEVERPAGRVRLAYNAVSREAIEGDLSDPAIRRLLSEVVRSSGNAGLRLDAIEALRGRAGEPEVRAALLRAVREDDNPGARLRAIDVLRQRATADPEVQRAIVEALLRDRNPGVRVGAIDLLASAPEPPGAGTLPLLERVARDDDNRYVRMRSAAVIEAAFHGGAK